MAEGESLGAKVVCVQTAATVAAAAVGEKGFALRGSIEGGWQAMLLDRPPAALYWKFRLQ